MKRILCIFLASALAACVSESSELTLSQPDRALFGQEVYPVLLRDCAFHACHGTTERFLQVFGPGRGRLDPMVMPLDAVTPAEIDYSYERARSMIDARTAEESLLLRKPLAAAAGGSGHEGADDLGRNVYQSKLEPGYAAIARWVLNAPALPAGP